MAHGRGGFARGRSSIVAHKEWSSGDDTASAIDIAEQTVTLGGVGLAPTEAVTLLRTRGSLGIQLDAGAVDERALIVFGITIVNVTAFTAGVAAVPSPVSEPDANWIWMGDVWLSSHAEAAISDTFLGQRLVIDSKAMRKIKPDEVQIIVGEVAESVDQTGTFDWQYHMRVLDGN